MAGKDNKLRVLGVSVSRGTGSCPSPGTRAHLPDLLRQYLQNIETDHGVFSEKLLQAFPRHKNQFAVFEYLGRQAVGLARDRSRKTKDAVRLRDPRKMSLFLRAGK